jgi:hypothetical protein
MLHPEDRLVARPDLHEKLLTATEVIESSCLAGAVAIGALYAQKIKFLLFTNAEMDAFSSPETSAFFGRLDEHGYMGLRESHLEAPGKAFMLLKNLAHEATHASQKDTLPSHEAVLTDPLHPQYAASTIAIEKNAYACTAEILLCIAHKEAVHMAEKSGSAVALKDTSTMKGWLEDFPEEASLCLQAFERKAAHTGRFEEGIQAARTAAVALYEVRNQAHDIQSCERKKQLRMDSGTTTPPPAPAAHSPPLSSAPSPARPLRPAR